jgi:hypothetical protein
VAVPAWSPNLLLTRFYGGALTDCNEESHIELQFKKNGYDVTAYYAVSEKMLHDAQVWANKSTDLSSINLRDWLDQHDAKLDLSDGPALVMVSANGVRILKNGIARACCIGRTDRPTWRSRLTAGDLKNGTAMV